MIRLHIICEGQTEEMFVKEVLSREYHLKDVYMFATLIGKPSHKGGRVNWDRLYTDIRGHLLGDPSTYCTTFFDFYGLATDFPGKEEAAHLRTISDKAKCVETALMAELGRKLGELPLRRFIPYVQMYEYEGLLFSDPSAFARGISKPQFANRFQSIRDNFQTPEDINDSPDTAPSKRILQIIQDYQKPIQGALGALEVGLSTMRHECVLFDEWLKRLELLAASEAGKS